VNPSSNYSSSSSSSSSPAAAAAPGAVAPAVLEVRLQHLLRPNQRQQRKQQQRGLVRLVAVLLLGRERVLPCTQRLMQLDGASSVFLEEGDRMSALQSLSWFTCVIARLVLPGRANFKSACYWSSCRSNRDCN
jgi:hypothetical protein